MLNPVWGFFLRSWFQRQHKVSRCGRVAHLLLSAWKLKLLLNVSDKSVCVLNGGHFKWYGIITGSLKGSQVRIISGVTPVWLQGMCVSCVMRVVTSDQWSWGSCVRVSVNTGNWPGATHWIRSADSITTIITDITVTIIPLLLVLASRPRHSKKNLVFTGARLMSNPRAIIVFVHFALNVPQYPGQYQ